MPIPLTIRPLVESDLPRYIPLRLQALRDHPSAFGSSYEDCRDLTPADWLARLSNALDGTHARLFCADPGPNLPLAALTGVFRDPGSKVRHSATLYHVYVHPSHRGQHLIDQLLTPVLDWCRTRDITLLRLTVTTTNTPALRCYHRLGFRTTGTLEQALRTPDGTHHDEYLMSRPV